MVGRIGSLVAAVACASLMQSCVSAENFREDFESYQADKSIAGQGQWQESMYGGHPSCRIAVVDDQGSPNQVLVTPGGRDYHVYRLLPIEAISALQTGKVIRIDFRYQGNVRLGMGKVAKLAEGRIAIKCSRGISVETKEKSFSGIASLEPGQWHRIMVLLSKETDNLSLKVASASDADVNGKYELIMGLDQVLLPFKATALKDWNGVSVRLDGTGKFDDLVLTVYDDPAEVSVELVPPKIEPKFSPVLDHIISPRQAIDLDGVWSAARVMEAQPNGVKDWQPVLVPDSHQDLFKGRSFVWFRRDFKLKQKEPNKRYFLCFERVTDGCSVLVNGKLVGSSDDGHFPFRLDATSAIRSGVNEILVKVAGPKVTGGAEVRPSGWSWFLPKFRGIPYPVHLEVAGRISVDDVFVMPQLKPESVLETHVVLTNHGDKPETVTLVASVVKEFSHQPAELEIKPGESREVVLRDPWQKPKLWWPHAPHLYNLEVKVKAGDEFVDAYRQSFGFRQLEVVGPDIKLNGVRFLHRRASMIPYWEKTTEESVREYIGLLRQRGYNGLRLHGGAAPRVVRECDRLGWLLSPESGINEPRADKVTPEFWQHAQKHLQGMVKTLRNSPSVVYWCLSNEFASYYMRGTKEEKAVVDGKMLDFGRMVEKLDPTRTWTVSGDGSLGGKGKDGPAPTISFHYPSEPFKRRFTLPVDAYWLEEPQYTSWHGIKWDKTKPLIFSEDLYMPYGIKPPGGMARWAGDKAYDMKHGFYEGWFECIRMLSEGYYFSKLAVWNPWGTSNSIPTNPLYELGQPMPDFLLATREQNSTFFSQENVRRTLYAYNEMFESYNCELKAELCRGSDVLNRIERHFDLAGGGMKQIDVTIPMPVVTQKTMLQWRLTLTAEGKELTTRTYDYTVYPPSGKSMAPAGCALLSGNAQFLADIEFPAGRFTALSQALASEANSLVLAKCPALSKEDREALKLAVRIGLNVLWLEPSASERFPVRVDSQSRETFAYVRAPKDPAMVNIDDSDLKLWRPDGLPVKMSFIKPQVGIFDLLADCGTCLQRTPLLRLYEGKGSQLLCSLPLVSEYDKEPAAAFVARELISHINSRPDRGRETLVLGRSMTTVQRVALKALGIPHRDGMPHKIYWASSSGLDEAELKKIKYCCENGGTVILDSLDPEGARKLSAFTGELIAVEAATVTELTKKSNSIPLLAGISNDDLYWRQKDDFHQEASKRLSGRPFTSKDIPMVDFVIKEGGKVKTPVSPGGIAVMPYLNGQIVMLTIKWREFLTIHQARVSRLLVSLLHNLGVESGVDDGLSREYAQVDMKQVVNREFWQKDEKVLAWFGLGQDDMRYFPVNRPGLDPVLKLPQPPEAFPTEPAICAGVGFKLVDPDTNGGKGCLVLGPGTQVSIPIGSPAKRIWMLGALSSHDSKGKTVATIQFDYADNSVASAELQAGVHLNGFQYATNMERGTIAWLGANPVRQDNVLWCWDIANPNVERQLKSLTIKVTGKKSLAIVATTLEK